MEFEWGFERVFPAGAPTLRFEIDGYPATDDEEFFAYRFDEPWNGFDQPAVDRDTLVAVVATAGDNAVLSWAGDTAIVNGDGYLVELPPDGNGHYHLRPLAGASPLWRIRTDPRRRPAQPLPRHRLAPCWIGCSPWESRPT